MLQNCVMNNHHDSISLIEDYLSLNNIEYQAHGYHIEIYPRDKNVVRVELTDENVLLITQTNKYNFHELENNFFHELKKLIS